jgi:hypothetical protein
MSNESYPKIEGKIGLFRTQPEPLPIPVRKLLAHGTSKLDANFAQRLPVVGINVWAVPGPREVCLLSQEALDGVGTTCAPITNVFREGLGVTFLSADRGSSSHRRILGIAPDGTTEVLAIGPHKRWRMRVKSNVFGLMDGREEPPTRYVLR